MKRALAFLAAGLIAGCAHFQPAPKYEIVGYYAGWKPDTKVDPSLLTVINYAFLDICWDGKHGNAATEALQHCSGANGSLALEIMFLPLCWHRWGRLAAWLAIDVVK